ncbi:HNH endonuclease [uncultured Fibrella sp.]|uniref:HNH endonuclease n=1 Tax=uncultured Fibrella sp. TaxID=1284596 RepID=UPI0035CA35CD
MARPNDFTPHTLALAKMRQKGRCGICGKYVDRLGMRAEGHHIRSAKYGGSNRVDNCVILCAEDEFGHRGGCHLFAHGDWYHREFELNRSEYTYLNG